MNSKTFKDLSEYDTIFKDFQDAMNPAQVKFLRYMHTFETTYKNISENITIKFTLNYCSSGVHR